MDLKKLRYLVVDIDGTLTDGSIYYDENGNEWKKFNVKDAAGFFALKEYGICTIVLTGRKCMATKRRMMEMKVDFLFQSIKNKKKFLEEFIVERGIKREDIGYVGDDLNDLGAMEICGFTAAPLDAAKEVINYVDFVSCKNGGEGVLRDIAEFVLKEEWDLVMAKIYNFVGK